MMQKLKNKLCQFVTYLLTIGPPKPQILKGNHPLLQHCFIIIDYFADDILYEILGVLSALVCHKFLRPLSFGFFGFILLEYVSQILFVAITNQWNLIFTQYAALLAGALVVRQTKKEN